MPGIAASTSDTCEFGSPPNAVAAPENSFAFELTWAWTSSPMTTSQSPVAPLMNFEVDVCTFMKIPWVTVGLRLRADRRLRQGDASPASDQCVIPVSGAISHRVRPFCQPDDKLHGLRPAGYTGSSSSRPKAGTWWLICPTAPYTARTSTTPGTALMAPAICGFSL